MKKLYISITLITLILLGGLLSFQAYSKKNIQQHTKTSIPSEYHDMSETTDFDDQVDLTAEKEVTVKIKDSKYASNNIKIKKGTKVTWVNEDEIEHNAMLDHEHSEIAHHAEENHDLSKFEGPLLAKGESYSYVFNEVSAYSYHCAPHPWMKGKVEVVE